MIATAGTFAELYRSMVAPKLREMCRVRGVLVALGMTSFGDAHAETMREAIRLGGAHLPALILNDLDASISKWLLQFASDAQQVIEQSRRRAVHIADRQVAHEHRWLH